MSKPQQHFLKFNGSHNQVSYEETFYFHHDREYSIEGYYLRLVVKPLPRACVDIYLYDIEYNTLIKTMIIDFTNAEPRM